MLRQHSKLQLKPTRYSQTTTKEPDMTDEETKHIRTLSSMDTLARPTNNDSSVKPIVTSMNSSLDGSVVTNAILSFENS